MKTVKPFFFFLLFSLIFVSTSFAKEKAYPLRLAVIDSTNVFPAENKKEQARETVYAYALPEIFSQYLRKIPETMALDRDVIHGALPYSLKNVKLNQVIDFGIDYLIQVEFALLEDKRIELHLKMMDVSDGKIESLRKLRGQEEKILEMLSDFTLVVAQYFKRDLTKKQIKEIKKSESVSISSMYRYGRGLDFYFKKQPGAAVLALEQFKKAEFFDLLFLPAYVARAKTNLFLYSNKVQPKRNLDAAYENLRKALFTDSKYLEAYELLSQVYYEKGNYVDSIREGFRALRLNSFSADARLSMARSYLKMDKRSNAVEQVEKVLEINPTNIEARKVLE